jgi:hypothetical protein
MSDCDCSSHAGTALKSLEEALELLLNHAKPVEGTETVALSDMPSIPQIFPVMLRVCRYPSEFRPAPPVSR